MNSSKMIVRKSFFSTRVTLRISVAGIVMKILFNHHHHQEHLHISIVCFINFLSLIVFVNGKRLHIIVIVMTLQRSGSSPRADIICSLSALGLSWSDIERWTWAAMSMNVEHVAVGDQTVTLYHIFVLPYHYHIVSKQEQLPQQRARTSKKHERCSFLAEVCQRR